MDKHPAVKLREAEHGVATGMQIADQLLSHSVELAELARRIKQSGSQSLLAISDAIVEMNQIVKAAPLVKADSKQVAIERYSEDVDDGLTDAALTLLSVLEEVSDDTVDSLLEWLNTRPGTGKFRSKKSPEITTTGLEMRRGPTMYGVYFKLPRQHGVRYVNLADLLLLARIGSRVLTNTTVTAMRNQRDEVDTPDWNE